jgi:phage-related protein (TIGR01555 family)
MAKKTGRVATADSYDNFVARVGMQQPNQHAASTYRANYTSRNRLLIEWAYRSSWIIGAAVDSKADDMTKKGVRITSEIDPKRRGILESRFDELQLWDCINETLKWSRLYGGAVALILIEGQAPLTPLVLDKVGKGSFKGLAVLDRWMINPQLTRRIKALGPNLGKPEFYDIVTTAQGLPAWTVHHSRLIRMDGVKLPYQQKITENEWGMSIVERIFDRLTSYDSTSVGAAQLAYKAHLRTAKIKKLREIIAMGGKRLKRLSRIWRWSASTRRTRVCPCLIRRTNLKLIPILSRACLTCLASLKRISRVLLAFLLSACSASHRRVFNR